MLGLAIYMWMLHFVTPQRRDRLTDTASSNTTNISLPDRVSMNF